MPPSARALCVLALLLGGCWGNETTLFPPGLEPLEDNPLAAPTDEPLEEGWVLDELDAPRFDTVYLRGHILAPLSEVWAAFRDPLVGTDRRGADEWTVEALEDPDYDESYIVHCVTYDIVTVEWSTTWRHGVVEGTPEAPTLVAIRWQKTEGSSILRLIEGSLVLRAAGDGSATELDMVYRVDAVASGLEDYRRYVEDTLADALAVLRGEPLASFD